MEFNSQICTTKEQSERLLALGLKKETADMGLAGDIPIAIEDWKTQDITLINSPAWSLHRLIEMIPDEITIPDTYDNDNCEGELEDLILEPILFKKSVGYSDSYATIFFEDYDNIYDNVIDCIEWLIEQEQFNEEYLEE